MYTRYQRNTCFRETHVFTKNTFLDSHVTCFTRSLSTWVYTVFKTELHVLKTCKRHSCESHDTQSCVRPETMCFEMSQKSVRCDVERFSQSLKPTLLCSRGNVPGFYKLQKGKECRSNCICEKEVIFKKYQITLGEKKK